MKLKIKKIIIIGSALVLILFNLTNLTEAKGARKENKNITEGEIWVANLYKDNFILSYINGNNNSNNINDSLIYKKGEEFGRIDAEELWTTGDTRYGVVDDKIIDMENNSLISIEKERKEVEQYLKEKYKDIKEEHINPFLLDVTKEGHPIFEFYLGEMDKEGELIYLYIKDGVIFENLSKIGNTKDTPKVIGEYLCLIEEDREGKYILNAKNMKTGKQKISNFNLNGEQRDLIDVIDNKIYFKEDKKIKIFEFNNENLNIKETIEIKGEFNIDLDFEGNIWQAEEGKVYKYENGKRILKKSYEEKYNRIIVYDEERMILAQNSYEEFSNEKIKLVYPNIIVGEWVEENGEWYYIENGIKQVGWKFLNGEYYYLNEDGIKQIGWAKIDDKKYYFDAYGVMARGKKEINGDMYYFDNVKGEMARNWVKTNYGWIYGSEDGKIVDSWQEINGEKYYFSNYIMAEGWRKIDDEVYFFNYETGLMKYGWMHYNEYNSEGYVFFDSMGRMIKEAWKYIEGKWYYFDEHGVMQTGWLNLDGKWYYLNSSGEMQTGWLNLNSKWYYLNNSGEMQKNWLELDGKWYYLNNSGEMQISWLELNGTWYYLNQSGVMETGWLDLNGTWYYLNYSGEMQTGWQLISNNWYYMYGSGVMATNTVIDGWKIGSNGVAVKL